MRSTARNRPVDLPRWVHAADAAVIALLVLALYVAIEGGFILRPGGFRVSIKSGWRVLAWAGVLLVLRHLITWQHPLHRRIMDGLGAAARAPGPLRDDLVWPAGVRREQPGQRPGRTHRIVVNAVAVCLLYAGATALMTYPQVRSMTSVSPDIGDPLFSTWRLAWVAHQLPRDPLHLFDANIFYPEQRTLAYSDSMIVPSLMVAPLVWLGVHQLVAGNLLLLSGFALSGAAMFLLVRSLTGHVGAALIAGFVFAFLPYRFMHYAHLELQIAQWMPLCLWAFHRTIDRGRLRDGVLTGLFLALQTLSSWYYGIFFATYLIVVGTVLGIGSGTQRILRSIRPLAAGALVAALLIAPFAIPYFMARKTVGERAVSEILFYSATPENYLAAHPRNAAFGKLTAGLGAQERELFQGIAVPVIACVGLWPPLSAVRMGYAFGLALAFEISLGFNGLLYPWLHAYVFPYRGLRVPARMAILVGLSLAILVGYGVARVSRQFRHRWVGAGACVVLTLLIFFEYRSRLTLEEIWLKPPDVYDQLRSRPSSVLLELPLMAPDIALEPVYMYFSTFHWHKLVNGYSGYSSPEYRRLVDLTTKLPDDDAVSEMRRRGVDFIVVHGAFYRPNAYERLVSGLDRRTDLALIARTTWQRRETRLYRLLGIPPVRDRPGAAGPIRQ